MTSETRAESFQPLMEWYFVRQTALDLVRIGQEAGIESKKLVFIGGMACFFHLESAFGKKQLVCWRGTKDIDFLVLGLGGAQRLIKQVKDTPTFDGWRIQKSHLPNKWSFQLFVSGGGGYLPEEKRWVDIDLYGQTETGGIVLNKRILKTDQLIYDPPQELNVGGRRLVVPSLRDTLIFKLDVLSYSPHLRRKDQFDVLGCLAVAEAENVPLNTLIRQVVDKINTREQFLRTKEALQGLAKEWRKGSFPENWPVPSREYLKNLTDYIPR